MKKVKLKLKHLHWQMLASDLKTVMAIAPVKGWEIETLVIAELYMNKMKFFTLEPYGSKEIALTLTQVQAHAINGFLSECSSNYNDFIRMMIEPKLLPGK